MLVTLDEAVARISNGEWLHIAGSASLLAKLPRGNWIGGVTEYFMADEGVVVSDEKLFLNAFPYEGCRIVEYDEDSIEDIAADAFDNGFSIAIFPFDSDVYITYAKRAAFYKDMFLKNIAGWVTGVNLSARGQTPLAANGLVVANGQTGARSGSVAVAMHVPLPGNRVANIGIINIFEPRPGGPVIEFDEEGFCVRRCRIGGTEAVLADYIAKNNINTRLPLIGDYAGAGVNVSVREVDRDAVYLCAPVFPGVKYYFASEIDDYAARFKSRLNRRKDSALPFSCNCFLNFTFGELEGERFDPFYGPITFGEVAYQLVNQTLVYVEII